MLSDGLFLEHALIFGTRPTFEHAVLLAVVDHLADRCTIGEAHEEQPQVYFFGDAAFLWKCHIFFYSRPYFGTCCTFGTHHSRTPRHVLKQAVLSRHILEHAHTLSRTLLEDAVFCDQVLRDLEFHTRRDTEVPPMIQVGAPMYGTTPDL